MTYRFYKSCVDWPRSDVYATGGLVELIKNRTQITRAKFLKNSHRPDLTALELHLGYDEKSAPGFVMKNDTDVEYFKSHLHGKIVYGFRHNAIKYVFILPATMG